MSVVPIGDDEGRVRSMEGFYEDFLGKVDQVDQWIHDVRADAVARLSAIRAAENPDLMARLEKSARHAEENPPQLDAPDFLERRLEQMKQRG